MDEDQQPLLGGTERNFEETSSGRKKKNICCILVFLIGVAALTAAILIAYFLKYIIGNINSTY